MRRLICRVFAIPGKRPLQQAPHPVPDPVSCVFQRYCGAIERTQDPIQGPGKIGCRINQRAVKIDIERQGRRLMMRHILGQISVQIPQQSRSVAIFLRLRKTMVRKCADFLARRGFDCKKLRYVWQK